jgi:hypothetical protein
MHASTAYLAGSRFNAKRGFRSHPELRICLSILSIRPEAIDLTVLCQDLTIEIDRDVRMILDKSRHLAAYASESLDLGFERVGKGTALFEIEWVFLHGQNWVRSIIASVDVHLDLLADPASPAL